MYLGVIFLVNLLVAVFFIPNSGVAVCLDMLPNTSS